MWLRDQTKRRLLFQVVFQVCVILSRASYHRYDVEQIAPSASCVSASAAGRAADVNTGTLRSFKQLSKSYERIGRYVYINI